MPTVLPKARSRQRVPRVGPDDHGRRMRLADFVRAKAAPGFNYELAHGVVEVTRIPGVRHHTSVRRLNKLITAYDLVHPEVIASVGGGAEAKIEMWGRETERHPDISIYLSDPPEGDDQPWDRWVPDIVVEVVSESSAKRDYGEKVADYLAAGVREYWIIDPIKQCVVFFVRRADTWNVKRLGATGKWHSTVLPDFVLDLAKVFQK